MKENKKNKQNKKKLHIKKNDLVKVITGKDSGTTGLVLSVDRYNEKLVVKGVNIVTKHVKPKGENEQGRIVKFEAPIHYSNVLLFCKESNRGERIRIQINDDNTKSRVFVKSGIIAD